MVVKKMVASALMEEGTEGTRRKRGVERRYGLTVRIQLENGGAARI
jgi:hypothetical protein